MKHREWLIKQNLTKAGARGRLSQAAKDALRQAIEDGMSFTDYNGPEVKDTKPKVSSPVRARKIISTNVRMRSETIMWGLDKARKSSHSDVIIAFDHCGFCSKTVSYCSCTTGPQLPRWIGGGVGLMKRP